MAVVDRWSLVVSRSDFANKRPDSRALDVHGNPRVTPHTPAFPQTREPAWARY